MLICLNMMFVSPGVSFDLDLGLLLVSTILLGSGLYNDLKSLFRFYILFLTQLHVANEMKNSKMFTYDSLR